MISFGKPIIKNGFFDVFTKQKTWLINRLQAKILEHYGNNATKLVYSRLFARISRKLVGAFMYSIKLEVNNYCTLNCKMCYVENKNNDLPFWLIKDLLLQTKSYKTKLEILGGEPLLRNDISKIIRFAKKEAKVPFVSLYTNGINLNPQLARELKNAGLDAIIVTLVSQKPDVHDEFTGKPGSWEKTIEGIKLCKNEGLGTYTFTAIHKYNYRDYQQLYDFVKNRLGAHALFYQYIPQQKNDPLMIDPKTWHEIKHWVMYCKNPGHAKYVSDFYMLTGNACSGGNFVFTVKVDGSVQPCPFVSNMPLGNIYEKSIWEIFKNRFKANGLKEFKSIPPECGNCVYKSVCAGGCKAGNDKIFGDYCHKDVRCLGPYAGPFKIDEIIDCTPSFF